MATWKTLLGVEMRVNGETLSDIESTTLSDEEFNREFNDGYGTSRGEPFTVWTTNRVYFPLVYDGAEWVGSVSRNPDGQPTSHFGGQ